jgi:hypothetical protein
MLPRTLTPAPGSPRYPALTRHAPTCCHARAWLLCNGSSNQTGHVCRQGTVADWALDLVSVSFGKGRKVGARGCLVWPCQSRRVGSVLLGPGRCKGLLLHSSLCATGQRVVAPRDHHLSCPAHASCPRARRRAAAAAQAPPCAPRESWRGRRRRSWVTSGAAGTPHLLGASPPDLRLSLLACTTSQGRGVQRCLVWAAALPFCLAGDTQHRCTEPRLQGAGASPVPAHRSPRHLSIQRPVPAQQQLPGVAAWAQPPALGRR